MRKSAIIIILITIVVASCKNNDKKEEFNTLQEAAQEQVDELLSTEWMKEIQLNNGDKWAANIETTEGVEEIQELLKTETTSSLKEYHQLASKLNDVKTKVVQECTMKGASHDNLHIWLYPLIKKIGALSETDNLGEASKIKQSIEENITAYGTYFH
jgi:ABC-type Zn2+ transport system substrate-binding protein/surface adhesin